MQTIYAVSTGAGQAGVAVVRLSGPATGEIVEAMAGLLPPSRQAVLRRLRHPGNGEVIDQALVLWFPAPHSFTGEDVAEFHVHGSRAVVRAVFDALAGMSVARPAESGEFTRRAFANGKIDLTEAEGLADLIGAETEEQRRAALKVALGENRALYEGWRRELIEARALIEAMVDFSDEGDAPDETRQAVMALCERVRGDMVAHLATAKRAERLRDGIMIVIAGPPNAGKSSLLNWLARREVAIVTPEAGTTRDLLEVHLDLDGLPMTICDTAGLRETDQPVEREGIRRARRRIDEADLVLWLSEIGGDAPAFSSETWSYRSKADLATVPSFDGLSIVSGAGLDELLARLGRFGRELIGRGDASPLMIRDRHKVAFEQAAGFLAEIAKNGPNQPVELMAESLRQTAQAIGRVTGMVQADEVLGEIFSRFCIGK